MKFKDIPKYTEGQSYEEYLKLFGNGRPAILCTLEGEDLAIDIDFFEKPLPFLNVVMGNGSATYTYKLTEIIHFPDGNRYDGEELKPEPKVIESVEDELDTIETLRKISNNLRAKYPNEEVIFPGWDLRKYAPVDEVDDETLEREIQELRERNLIIDAATAVIAHGISPDDNLTATHEEIAALIHYLADMME